ncbi:hypothetical protein [Rhodococcus globerulus]|uniref:Helix-turn-helix protein n=1 Tax=Nocardia globerula TaxID=1818 RepID=A0A652YI04_NOCGL|nr:hypothetical protein [Rhodococcus globerulus]NMD64277.1 XRE family transcriptional regulator [Nocardia globerula]
MNDLRDRFARLVSERRAYLNLTRDQLQAEGGPSDVTTAKIERGDVEQPTVSTFKKLDKGLRWTEGSAARAFIGDNPVPLEDVPGARPASPIVGADEDSVTLPLSVVIAISEIAKRYEKLHSSLTDAATAGQLQKVNEDLDLVVDRILRAWLIAQVESKMAQPGRMQVEPMVEMLIGDYLNRAAEPPTPEDARDLQYLRWLTGRPEDLDSATQKSFIAQWQSRQEKNR